jgi:hypothetical protein
VPCGAATVLELVVVGAADVPEPFSVGCPFAPRLSEVELLGDVEGVAIVRTLLCL